MGRRKGGAGFICSHLLDGPDSLIFCCTKFSPCRIPTIRSFRMMSSCENSLWSHTRPIRSPTISPRPCPCHAERISDRQWGHLTIPTGTTTRGQRSSIAVQLLSKSTTKSEVNYKKRLAGSTEAPVDLTPSHTSNPCSKSLYIQACRSLSIIDTEIRLLGPGVLCLFVCIPSKGSKPTRIHSTRGTVCTGEGSGVRGPAADEARGWERRVRLPRGAGGSAGERARRARGGRGQDHHDRSEGSPLELREGSNSCRNTAAVAMISEEPGRGEGSEVTLFVCFGFGTGQVFGSRRPAVFSSNGDVECLRWTGVLPWSSNGSPACFARPEVVQVLLRGLTRDDLGADAAEEGVPEGRMVLLDVRTDVAAVMVLSSGLIAAAAPEYPRAAMYGVERGFIVPFEVLWACKGLVAAFLAAVARVVARLGRRRAAGACFRGWVPA